MKSEEITESLIGTNFIQSLGQLFSTGALETIACETGFIVRSSSRLSGEMFLNLNVVDFECMSLTEKCVWLSEQYSVELSKQSLDERYHSYAVKFMKACFERVLSAYMRDFEDMGRLQSKFSAVKITDSTSFQLPSALSVFYASNGGDTSGSSIKIHQSYDLLKGQILDFQVTDGKSNDSRYWQEGSLSIEAGELHLADLGYYTLAHLQAIQTQNAYFITRYKTNTTLYTRTKAGDLVPLDLASVVAKVGKSMELPEVYVGKEARLPTRLLIEKLPEEVTHRRLQQLKSRHANRSKKGRDYQNSDLKKCLCGYNLFLTNAPSELLNATEVAQYYRLRWQIELLFKIWKSLWNIDKIGKMSIFRFECYLYGKLIAILLTQQIQAYLRNTFAFDPDIDIELSEWKAIKHLKKSRGVM